MKQIGPLELARLIQEYCLSNGIDFDEAEIMEWAIAQYRKAKTH